MHTGIELSTAKRHLEKLNFQNFIKNNKKELSYWGLLAAAIVTIYFLFSDGEFSFCYTLSAIVQMFGFLLIVIQIQKTRSAEGISLNTLICYTVGFASKLSSILFNQGYLPTDSTGDTVYRISEVLSFILSAYVSYLVFSKYKATYNAEQDRIKAYFIIIPALILACLIHPALNGVYYPDIAWTFALYLESFAMLPQLYMLAKKGGKVEAFTSHFIASQGFARCLAFFFWLDSAVELNQLDGPLWTLFSGSTGNAVVLSQLIQIVLFSDFLYQYVKSLQTGIPMSLDSCV